MRYHLNFRDLNGRNESPSFFRREAQKLARPLSDFKPELIDVWGSVEPLPRNAGYTAQMRLHLPSGTLTAEAKGYSRAGAWVEVTKEMLVRIERHKARLTGCRSRQRRHHEARRWQEHAGRPERVQAYIQAGYPALLDFLRTEIRLHITKGNLPKTFADATELADEVAMEVLRNPGGKPEDLSYEHWFLKLGYERVMDAVDRARHERRTRKRRATSIDTILPRREGPEGLTDEEDLVDELIGPRPRVRYGHDIPDPNTVW